MCAAASRRCRSAGTNDQPYSHSAAFSASEKAPASMTSDSTSANSAPRAMRDAISARAPSSFDIRRVDDVAQGLRLTPDGLAIAGPPPVAKNDIARDIEFKPLTAKARGRK